MHQSIRLPDGRVLSFEASGAVDGYPVVFFHGVPGSRLYWSLADDGSEAAAADMRVFAPDRPGIGGSSSDPDRTVVSFARDIEALANEYDWQRFGVIGFSGGAAYALACAAVLPERVAAVALVAPMADLTDPSLKASLDPTVRRGLSVASRSQAFLQSSVVTRLDANHFIRAAADIIWSSLPSSDRRLLAKPAVRESAKRVLVEAAAQGLEGPRLDAEILGRPWEFDVDDVRAPVAVHVGGADPWSTDAMAHWLRVRLARSTVHRYAGEGHFTTLVTMLPTILKTLAADLRQDEPVAAAAADDEAVLLA